jgi:IMP dehydrogenase
MSISLGLTFDDVLLVPAASEVMPADVDVATRITKEINLNIPLMSAAMDTVTETDLAIAMSQAGGIGVLHRNMDPDDQADMVRQVKKFEAGMVVNPVTMQPDQTLAEALELMANHKISGVPVVEPNGKGGKGKLVGMLTNRDVRFAEKLKQPVSELMTRDNLVTVEEGFDPREAKRLLHQHRIEKLIVVDKAFNCVGLITVKDMEKASLYPNAAKDSEGRLRIAAATTVGNEGLGRSEALIDAGCDLLVLDTAHGHSFRVVEAARQIKKLSNKVQLMAGNVATGEAAKALIDAGVDAVKVGIGPGSICTTRIVAGVGVPQLTAIMNTTEVCEKAGIPVTADGGIKSSGDIAKAIGAGASCVMLGSLLAGTEEAPGEVFLYKGRTYKSYRGMGSVGAMSRGSADRYFQEDIEDALKLVPEGVEAQVPFKGSVANVLHQMVGGLRAAMGYTGSATVADLRKKAEFIRITNSGLRESHVHGVAITRESPNYPRE